MNRQTTACLTQPTDGRSDVSVSNSLPDRLVCHVRAETIVAVDGVTKGECTAARVNQAKHEAARLALVKLRAEE